MPDTFIDDEGRKLTVVGFSNVPGYAECEGPDGYRTLRRVSQLETGGIEVPNVIVGRDPGDETDA